ncbi:hypothetical protein EVA_06623 [gut metagenome]|uniref:Uncharacterized protein n=1 Tax=gut metagenome TaxID=749906 RepID=J9GD53_9ZZZZ
MAVEAKLVMSWSKCKIEYGKTGASDAMATALKSLGVISDKSTSMTTEEGESLEAKATGGVIVAFEQGEPIVSITTRVKEPTFDLEKELTGATVGGTSSDELKVKTNVVIGDFSLKLTPKNIGSVGIKARKCHVSYKPGYSEEEGHYADITFKILACADGELYTKYKVAAKDWQ